MDYILNLNDSFEYNFLHPGILINDNNYNICYKKNEKNYLKKIINKKLNIDKHLLKDTDLFLGMILSLKDNFAVIEIDKILNKNISLNNNVFFLFPNNVKKIQLETLKNYLAERDLLLFKIKDNKATIIDDQLGVILTNCSKCNTQINKIINFEGICTNCGTVNYRKYSTKYGLANF